MFTQLLRTKLAHCQRKQGNPSNLSNLLLACILILALASTTTTDASAGQNVPIALLQPATDGIPPCLPIGTMLATPLNATLMAMSQLNVIGAAAGGWQFSPVITKLSSQPTSQEYVDTISHLASQGIHYVLDWSMDADDRRQISAVLSENNMELWSAAPSMEECDPNVFSTGATPNVAVSPSIGYVVSRADSSTGYFLITTTSSDPAKSSINSNSDAMTEIMKTQLRWSGGSIIGTNSVDAASPNLSSVVSSILTTQVQLNSTSGVVIFASLPSSLRNSFLSEMLAQGLTQANGFSVMLFAYSEPEAWSFACSNPMASSLEVLSSSSYLHNVNSPANAAFVAQYAAAYGIASPIMSDLVAQTYTAMYLLGTSVMTALSVDSRRVATAARGSSMVAPLGNIDVIPNHHVTQHTRLGHVNFALSNTSISLEFECYRARKPQVWNQYISANEGFDCDWSVDTRGSRYVYDHVFVGILHSVTGGLAISERAVVDAELLAIDEINDAGGVNGNIVIPRFADGASDWPNFAVQAKILTDNPNITSVFGCWTSVSRQYVLPVFEAADKLLWYPVQHEGQECSKNIFYLGATPNQQIEPSLDWLLRNKSNLRQFFLVGSDYVFPRTANRVIRSYLHTYAQTASVVAEMYLPLSGLSKQEMAAQVDTILREVQRLMPAGGVIYNTLNGDANVEFFRAMKALDMTPDIYPTMSASISETEIAAIGTRVLQGHFASWNYYQSVGNSDDGLKYINDPTAALTANAVFVAAFKGKFGLDRVLNDPMEAAYIGVHIWKQAAEQAAVIDVDKLRTAAYGQMFEAPEGPVVMSSSHHLSKSVRVGQVNAMGQFDVVSDITAAVVAQAWSNFINTTANYRCDWSDTTNANPGFELYPTITIAVLSGFSEPHTLSERSNLDALQLAVEEANADPILPGYTLNVRVLDDAGDETGAESNLSSALLDPEVSAVFITSPTAHSVLASPSVSLESLLADSTKLIISTRASSSSAVSCRASLIQVGATLNQLVEPAVLHLHERGRTDFVLLVPDAAIAIASGLQLRSAEVRAYIDALLPDESIDLVTVPFYSDSKSVRLQLQTLIAAHPRKGTLLNFLPQSLSMLLFQSFYDMGMSSADYPILSFALDIVDVRAMISQSSAGQQLFAGHSFAETWTLQPGAKESSDMIAGIRSEHGSIAELTPDMDSAYSAIGLWAAAARSTGSLDGERIRQMAYLTAAGSVTRTSPGSDVLQTNNQVGKYFHLVELGRSSTFQVIYPTNSAGMYVKPLPFRMLTGAVAASQASCEFSPREVVLSFNPVLKGVVFMFAGLVMAISGLSMAITHHYRATPIIKHISPVFCGLTQSALFMLGVAAVFMVTQHSHTHS